MEKRGLTLRKIANQTAQVLAGLATLVSLGGMLWILGTTIVRGGNSLSWDFLTEPTKPFGIEPSGIGNALQGTLYITAMATLLALPPGLLGGIWLSEYGRGIRIARWIRFCANVMMGIPSIITGLFVYAVLVVPSGCFSGFAGSCSLAIVMIPLVMRTTEEMLAMVPDSLREASLALGLPRWRATLSVVCRAAAGGLASGVLLALARVSGETAPLLFTALWSNDWCSRFFTGPTANVPVVIAEYTTNSPFEQFHAAGWGAALVMMIVILAINIAVRFCFRERL